MRQIATQPLTILALLHFVGSWACGLVRLEVDGPNEDYHLDYHEDSDVFDRLLMVAIAEERGLEVMEELEAEPEDLGDGWSRLYLAIRQDVWEQAPWLSGPLEGTASDWADKEPA